ncbi:MAG TPA: DMT family transporter [Nonomuraea sp.]|nr:DMT family transporter [Nonomuraea sp.]
MSGLARGVPPLIAYGFLMAAVDVYAGNRLQTVDPITVAAIAFTLAAAYFLAGEIGRKGLAGALRPVRGHRHDVIAINIVSAVTWLTLLYALRQLEPAIVNVVALSIGPALVALLGPLLRRGHRVLPGEVAVSLGVLALIGVLMWGSATGMSGLGRLDSGDAALGLALTLVCGLSCTANVIYSKRLSDAGFTPSSSMAVRYFLTVAVCWTLLIIGGDPRIGAAILPGAVVAVIGIALPNWLSQVGIKHVEPITAALLGTLSPIFAFLMQLLDSRLSPSGLTLAGLVGITILVTVGVVVRARHDRSTTDTSAGGTVAGAATVPAGTGGP